MTREESEQQKKDENDMEELLANYRAVRSLGKWAVIIVTFLGTIAYVLVQVRHLIMK